MQLFAKFKEILRRRFRATLNLYLHEKEQIAAYAKLARSTVFVCLNYSTGLSTDDFVLI